jgi:hypothetical protein
LSDDTNEGTDYLHPDALTTALDSPTAASSLHTSREGKRGRQSDGEGMGEDRGGVYIESTGIGSNTTITYLGQTHIPLVCVPLDEFADDPTVCSNTQLLTTSVSSPLLPRMPSHSFTTTATSPITTGGAGADAGTFAGGTGSPDRQRQRSALRLQVTAATAARDAELYRQRYDRECTLRAELARGYEAKLTAARAFEKELLERVLTLEKRLRRFAYMSADEEAAAAARVEGGSALEMDM